MECKQKQILRREESDLIVHLKYLRLECANISLYSFKSRFGYDVLIIINNNKLKIQIVTKQKTPMAQL